MKKRVLAVMLAGGMVLGAQTGVWAASDTSNQKEGELTLLLTNSLIDGSGANSEEFKKVIKQYEEENPGVKITLQGASQQDIKESFQTAALAGRGADIVMMDNSGHAIDLAAMGLLYSLEELTTDEELTAQYQEGPLDSGKFEGKYYSVPWNMDCTGLYYNKERLDELGIDVPTTWKELSDAVDKVKEAGYGGIITYQSAYAFYSFFYQNECPVIDTSGDVPKVVIDNEEGKEAWNYICDLIKESGIFALSLLDVECSFETIKHFGFQSGRDVDKMKDLSLPVDYNDIPYLGYQTCAVISGKVLEQQDLGTHTLFIAEVTDAKLLNENEPLTYADYQNRVKPKKKEIPQDKKIVGWRCKICNYVYEGSELPPDYTCPLCGHDISDFEPIYERR